jgi:hypothetical protein
LLLFPQKRRAFFPSRTRQLAGRSHQPRSAYKSLFASFSSEKEESSILSSFLAIKAAGWSSL